MTCYVDSSVALRIVLGEPRPLRGWAALDRIVASELVRLECLRTIDQMRLRLRLPDAEVAGRRAAVLDLLRRCDVVKVGSQILTRAADPLPTSLGTLDAVHLATALILRDADPTLTFATHDEELATAARAMGFQVLGAAPA